MSSGEVVVISYQISLFEDDCLIGQTEVSVFWPRWCVFTLIPFHVYFITRNCDYKETDAFNMLRGSSSGVKHYCNAVDDDDFYQQMTSRFEIQIEYSIGVKCQSRRLINSSSIPIMYYMNVAITQ